MSTFPNSPRLLKGGIVLIDSVTAAVRRIIALQYNPESISRTFQIKGVTGDGGDRSEALRLTGPPVETIKVDAEIDATDQLEIADRTATQVGLHPQLAALELIIYPTSAHLQDNNTLAQQGALEILPFETPLTLFVWSKQRIMPVRFTELSVTEEEFDPALNPIRAKVSLGMRGLTVDDLSFDHKGSGLFMAYLRTKEQLSTRGPGAAFGALGITGI